MNPMLQEAMASIVRWVLAIGAGVLVKGGIWTEGSATAYVAAGSLAVVAIGWSLFQKYAMRTKLVTSLASGPSTEEEIEQKIAAGNTPPVSTPKNMPPRR